MNRFCAALRGELTKLSARKKYFVFLVIEVLICAFTMLVQALLSRLSQGLMQTGVFGLTFGLLGFFIRFFIPLIIFMAACDLFSTEAHDSSIRASLLRPVSRFKVYLSKCAAIVVIATLYLAALFAVTVALELFTGGSLRTVWTGLWSYALDLLPLIVIVLMAALICQIVPGPTLSMLVSVVVYMGLVIVGIFFSRLGGILFTSYSSWHNLWIGSPLPFTAMLPKIALLVGYSVVMLMGGYLLFDRKDF